MAQAAVLKLCQYRHLLRVTKATSCDPERDVFVLLLGTHIGMRVSEIAQIEVGDVLFPSGAVRDEVSLRATGNSFHKMDSELPQLWSASVQLLSVHFVKNENGRNGIEMSICQVGIGISEEHRSAPVANKTAPWY